MARSFLFRTPALPNPLAFLLFAVSCLEPLAPPAKDCSSTNLFIKTEELVNTGCGVPAGKIVVAAFGGIGDKLFTLNNGSPQSSGLFDGLRPGRYIVSVMDSAGCQTSVEAHLTSGISYRETVKPIIEGNCTSIGCHDGTTGAIDFRIFKNVQEKAADIKGRTRSRNMPKEGQLTDEEIEQISCWVDDGALDN